MREVVAVFSIVSPFHDRAVLSRFFPLRTFGFDPLNLP